MRSCGGEFSLKGEPAAVRNTVELVEWCIADFVGGNCLRPALTVGAMPTAFAWAWFDSQPSGLDRTPVALSAMSAARMPTQSRGHGTRRSLDQTKNRLLTCAARQYAEGVKQQSEGSRAKRAHPGGRQPRRCGRSRKPVNQDRGTAFPGRPPPSARGSGGHFLSHPRVFQNVRNCEIITREVKR
jgi:hypothetical protein